MGKGRKGGEKGRRVRRGDGYGPVVFPHQSNHNFTTGYVNVLLYGYMFLFQLYCIHVLRDDVCSHVIDVRVIYRRKFSGPRKT